MLILYSVEDDRLAARAWVTGKAQAPTGQSQATPPVLWYDLLDPTIEERAFVNGRAGVKIPSREDMEEIELSSRLYRDGDCTYMTATTATYIDTDNPAKTPVVFILGRRSLVSVRYAPLRPFANVVERLTHSGGASAYSPETLMLELLDALVDRLADALEGIGERIDAFSHSVFRAKGADAAIRNRDLQVMIENVGREGDLLGVVRESLVSLNRLVGYHKGGAPAARMGEDVLARVQSVLGDIVALSDHATYLGAKMNFLLDASLGLINLEQNQIIKIFSIAAVCLMPPTLIASIYGMNFKHLPELDWPLGYPFALGLMAVAAVTPFAYFKKRGWL